MLNLGSSTSDTEDRSVKKPLTSKVCVQDTDAICDKNEEDAVDVRQEGPPEAAVVGPISVDDNGNPQEAQLPPQNKDSQGQSSDTVKGCSLTEFMAQEPVVCSPKAEDGISKKHSDEGAPGLGTGSLDIKAGGLVDGEWVICSTAFIGPMCRPEPTESKGDLEDKLNEFYKELEEIEPAETPANSSNRDESCIEGKKPINSGHSEGKRAHFNKGHRPYHQPHLDRDPLSEESHPRKRRRNFQYGLDAGSWDPYYYQDQWQQPPSVGGPYGPPYSRLNEPEFYGPAKVPPPPDPLYHPDFRPHMNAYYDYPRPVPGEWEHPLLLGTEFAGYDGYSDHSTSQGYSESFYPPYNWENNQGNSYASCRDGAWFQSSDWRARFNGQHGRWQRYYSEEYCEPPNLKNNSFDSPLVLILLRGLPGSGKSTLAQELLSSGPNGLVLSTDDYFCQGTGYAYDPSLLGDAHSWNHNRAKEAMDEGRSPVIIDNTNMQAWEMKPYVEMALERGYRVDFCEPSTSWKLDPTELEKRNKHGVSRQKIAEMRERFELPMSLDIVLNSQQPLHKSRGHCLPLPQQ